MARMTSMETLEHKIEKAKEQVIRTKKQYDSATAALSDLLDKKDALRRDELIKAIMKSDRTYEEVIDFLNTESDEKSTKTNGKSSRKTKRNN